mmetsp:Transcript_11004/g.44325  ORF Transcript_11004/g.44325 Transcript_11004/m.44325 type:complete len:231 (-) Transcript_11004:1521-2213(-)
MPTATGARRHASPPAVRGRRARAGALGSPRGWPPRRPHPVLPRPETTARSSGGSPPWEWATAWSRRPRSRGRHWPARSPPRSTHRSARRPSTASDRARSPCASRRSEPPSAGSSWTSSSTTSAESSRRTRPNAPISSGASSPSSGPRLSRLARRSARARTCFRLSTSTSSLPCRTLCPRSRTRMPSRRWSESSAGRWMRCSRPSRRAPSRRLRWVRFTARRSSAAGRRWR